METCMPLICGDVVVDTYSYDSRFFVTEAKEKVTFDKK